MSGDDQFFEAFANFLRSHFVSLVSAVAGRNLTRHLYDLSEQVPGEPGTSMCRVSRRALFDFAGVPGHFRMYYLRDALLLVVRQESHRCRLVHSTGIMIL